jgi:nitrogen regulatory protein PII-like uncharacterized protein
VKSLFYRSKLALAATAFAAAPSLVPDVATGPALAQAQVPPELEMAAQQPPFRHVADEFIAAAAAGDANKVAGVISPVIVANTGQESVDRYLNSQVLPFFAEFKELGRSTTITRTAGVPGFVFYMYMVTKTDEMRPFVIYVVEERGAKVVANVLVHHLVPDRHCVLVADRWRCPNFS